MIDARYAYLSDLVLGGATPLDAERLGEVIDEGGAAVSPCSDSGVQLAHNRMGVIVGLFHLDATFVIESEDVDQ